MARVIKQKIEASVDKERPLVQDSIDTRCKKSIQKRTADEIGKENLVSKKAKPTTPTLKHQHKNVLVHSETLVSISLLINDIAQK